MEISIEILQKLYRQPPHDPVIPLLGISLKDSLSYHRDTCTPIFRARKQRHTRCPSSDEWIMKNSTFISCNIQTIQKKNEIFMEIVIILLSQVTQAQKDKQCFLLFVNVSFDSLDMCVSFGITIEVRNSAKYLGSEQVSREGKQNTVILKENTDTGRVKQERKGHSSTEEGTET